MPGLVVPCSGIQIVPDPFPSKLGRIQLPKPDTSGQPRYVAADFHVVWRCDKLARVATTDVQNVVVHKRAEDGDGLVYPMAPSFRAFATHGGIAELVIVGLVVVGWMMRQFEMGHQFTIPEQGSTRSSPQRENHLQAVAADQP